MEEKASEYRCTDHTKPQTAYTCVVHTRQVQCEWNSYEPKRGECYYQCVELNPSCSQGANSWLLETLDEQVDQHERPRLVKNSDDLLILCKYMHDRFLRQKKQANHEAGDYHR